MLAFVEGSMERQFINSNFRYVHVIPVKNGSAWSCERLCDQIVNSYLAFDYSGDVFVWVDREGRIESAEEIRNEIRARLINSGADPDRLYVLINDRMAENTILADEATIRDTFDQPNYTYDFEGRGGKHILKELFRQLGINYKEMYHGLNLLKKIRLS